MILLQIDKNNTTTWTEVKQVEVTEQYITVFDGAQFATRNYEDIRYAELILPNGGKAVLYRDETGGK